MKCRASLCVVLAVVAVGCLGAPLAQAATSWKIKDRAGRVAGFVKVARSDYGTHGYVVDLVPRRVPAGWVFAEPWGGYATAYRGGLFFGDINYYGESPTRFRTQSGRGLAVKRAGAWVLLKRVKSSWRRVGTVPLSCEDQWVLGCGILLFGLR